MFPVCRRGSARAGGLEAGLRGLTGGVLRDVGYLDEDIVVLEFRNGVVLDVCGFFLWYLSANDPTLESLN